MPTIKIDNQEYDLDTLPDAAKQQVQMLQFVEGELSRLQAQSAVLKTAQIAYARALKEAIVKEAPSEPVPASPVFIDTIKFS